MLFSILGILWNQGHITADCTNDKAGGETSRPYISDANNKKAEKGSNSKANPTSLLKTTFPVIIFGYEDQEKWGCKFLSFKLFHLPI